MMLHTYSDGGDVSIRGVVLPWVEANHGCWEGRVLLKRFPHDSWARAWAESRHGENMLWVLERVLETSSDAAAQAWLRMCGCACAATALKYTTDPRAETAIAVAWRYAIGDADHTELRAAHHAADTAAQAATGAALAAAWAARDAADSRAYVVARAVVTAASRGRSGARAVTEADATCADIVRGFFPHAPVLRT